MEEVEFKIGTPVYTQDGRCGTLVKVVLDPHTRRVTDLIVEKGFLQKKDRVIPVSAVQEVSDERIVLNITSEQLAHFPEFREEEFRVPAPEFEKETPYTAAQILHWATRYGIAIDHLRPIVRYKVKVGVDPEERVIGRGTRVVALDGPVGEVDHVLVDPQSRQVTHFVIKKGILPRHVVVPMTLVSNVLDDAIYLKVDKQYLDQLTQHVRRPDEDIAAEVRDRLAEVKEHDLSRVQVTVHEGIVRLTGQVKDVDARRTAEMVARRVEGVIDVENQLTTDTGVVARVTAALLEDPRTRLYPIDVASDHGIVTLSGTVPSEEVKKAAEEIARRQKGVVQVINALQVREEEEEPLLPPVAPLVP